MNCNQINIFIILEIIGEEDKTKKIISILKKKKKKFRNLIKPLDTIIISKPILYLSKTYVQYLGAVP